MRKEKTIFLLGLLVVASLLITACTQSASNGEVETQNDEDIQTILDAIENQPAVEMTPTATVASDTQGAEETAGETPETPQADQPTATPTPVPTKEVVQVELTDPC